VQEILAIIKKMDQFEDEMPQFDKDDFEDRLEELDLD
jgi:hypothetical protein